MEKNDNNYKLKVLLLGVTILLIGVSIAYAALSTTLTISFGTVSQSALSWNVGFVGTSASATVGGSSSTGRSCGDATITKSSVSIANSQLSKPGDSCTYQLTIKNDGTIAATLTSITPTAPNGVTCETSTGGTLACGNITYKLATDSTGNTVFTSGGTLNPTDTQTVYLIASFTGNNPASSATTHSGAMFTLVYDQQ